MHLMHLMYLEDEQRGTHLIFGEAATAVGVGLLEHFGQVFDLLCRGKFTWHHLLPVAVLGILLLFVEPATVAVGAAAVSKRSSAPLPLCSKEGG